MNNNLQLIPFSILSTVIIFSSYLILLFLERIIRRIMKLFSHRLPCSQCKPDLSSLCKRVRYRTALNTKRHHHCKPLSTSSRAVNRDLRKFMNFHVFSGARTTITKCNSTVVLLPFRLCPRRTRCFCSVPNSAHSFLPYKTIPLYSLRIVSHTQSCVVRHNTRERIRKVSFIGGLFGCYS